MSRPLFRGQVTLDYGFCLSPNGGYYKFPPIIGAFGQVDILFVAINPRRSGTNLDLHNGLVTSKQNFFDLAHNRTNGVPYIHRQAVENFYHPYLDLLQQVYGVYRSFESCAAATELFLCASKDSAKLPKQGSRCADKFLPRVIAIVQPKVIVTVGQRVHNYFKGLPEASLLRGKYAVSVAMPHPRQLATLDAVQKMKRIDSCAQEIRRCLK